MKTNTLNNNNFINFDLNLKIIIVQRQKIFMNKINEEENVRFMSFNESF